VNETTTAWKATLTPKPGRGTNQTGGVQEGLISEHIRWDALRSYNHRASLGQEARSQSLAPQTQQEQRPALTLPAPRSVPPENGLPGFILG